MGIIWLQLSLCSRAELERILMGLASVEADFTNGIDLSHLLTDILDVYPSPDAAAAAVHNGQVPLSFSSWNPPEQGRQNLFISIPS